jgi:DNA-binding MarR family transcriptional regulator
MQLLQKRSTSRREPRPQKASSGVERQSVELLGHLDALFRRLILPRQPAEEQNLELSREEMRAIILLRTSGRSIMTDFAESLGIPLSTATHTIDRLVHKGLVIRVRSDADRRIVQVEMSESGKKLHAALRAKHEAMARSWLEPLSPNERETFLSMMSKIAKGAAPGPKRSQAGSPNAFREERVNDPS